MSQPSENSEHEFLISQSQHEIEFITEFLKNYKNIVNALESYQKSKLSRNYPESKKQLDSIQKEFSKMDILLKKYSIDQLPLENLNRVKSFFLEEKKLISSFKEKFYYDCLENFDSDFKLYGFENVEGGVGDGAKVKNFFVRFDKDGFKITIFYLVERLKLKFKKIDGLDTKEAAKTISDFYDNPKYSDENIQNTCTKLYQLYLQIKTDDEKAEVIDLLKKFYEIKDDKISIEKRIEFSFILHKIKTLEIKTSDGKSLGTSKATGQFQVDPNHYLSIPEGNSVDIDNVMYVIFR